MTNPLLEEWATPFGMLPFDRIDDKDFEAAVDVALVEARARVSAISDADDVPSFQNTIEALELADQLLGRVLGAFYALAGADSTPTREELTRKFSPMLAEYSSEIASNSKLFARIEALWDTRDSLDLTDEQQRVLMLTRRGFVRAGAQLSGAEAKRHADIEKRLAELGTKFTQNLLADERAWSMPLSDLTLSSLPGFVASAARAAGEERGEGGAVLTLSRSLIVPFLHYCPDRALRRKAYEAWTARGANGGETDNRAVAAEILSLREERAQLLGFENFAQYKLETEMAEEPERVKALLMDVWRPAVRAAEKDAAEYEKLLLADGYTGPLEPWDWRYYAERTRKEVHDIDETELNAFFQLDNLLAAAFACAHRLFGLQFEEVDVPKYNPDVRAWKVTRDGQDLALFLGDYFARSSKRSGAWCSAMRSQQKLAGNIRPIVVNVCNFAKPAQGEPSLLSFDDARTLFHELGHALHQMLSDVSYESISGTSVARDFVELPSQLFEHWLEVPEVLSEFARHYETDAPLPEEMMQRLLAASTFDMGFQTVEYVASALVDLAFHDGPAPADPMQKQAEVLEGIGMPRAIGMRHATPHFAHVFSGDGYSSGYYSYMWSEVMDADVFAAFEEVGDPFDPTLARKLEEDILSKGGSEDASALYTRFRGRMPGVEALLRGRGLMASEA